MLVLTTPSTAAHAFGYSKTNLNNAYDTPLENHYRYLYDRDKRLTSTLFPSGKSIVNTYANGVLAKTSTPEGDIDYTYLCASKLGSIAKGGESIAYAYDASLVTSETLAGTVNQTLSYVYDNDFRPTRFSYSGASTDYAYDADGLLTQAGAFAITRNAQNGLPTLVSDTAAGGALSIARAFNAFGEQDAQTYTVASATPFTWAVVRDAAGRITRKTETTPSATLVYDYAYDALGRLLTVRANDSLVEEYRYY